MIQNLLCIQSSNKVAKFVLYVVPICERFQKVVVLAPLGWWRQPDLQRAVVYLGINIRRFDQPPFLNSAVNNRLILGATIGSGDSSHAGVMERSTKGVGFEG